MQRQLVSNNISYSLLKAFDDEGPNALVYRKKVENAGINFGTMLDDFISLEKDVFNSKYLISTNTISGDLLTLAKIVADGKFDMDDLSIVHKTMIASDSIKHNLFKAVTKESTRLSKFDNQEFYDFVKLLRKYKGRTFITPAEYSKLVDCRASLYNHKSTKKYFNCGDDCEELYQVEINFKLQGRNIKTILDKVIINHHEKTIQGLDLKSGSVNASDFMKNFFTYKYYIQGALYNSALEAYRAENEEIFDYIILPFKYIFLPTFNIYNPKTFILTDKWLKAAWNGFRTNSGYKHRGINELIFEINWHIQHQVFDETRTFYENEEIALDDSFITVE